MRLYTAAQIREWDQYTIQHEPILSINLMERAAVQCVNWIVAKNFPENQFAIFCGKGNNGGDGLAIARLLADKNCNVKVCILESASSGTEDFLVNLARLDQYPDVEKIFLEDKHSFSAISEDTIIIDALFGTGLARPLEGLAAALVNHINRSSCFIISVDMPSGLPADGPIIGGPVVQAGCTLSFQCYKPAFLVAENTDYIGEVHILDIGLLGNFQPSPLPVNQITDAAEIKSVFKRRNRFSHKGHFGHALIIAGSYGKMGAALFSARACLRSGCGLLTCHIPSCGYDIMQQGVPEAMVITDFNSSMITGISEPVAEFDAVGIGPGLGTASETRAMLRQLFLSIKKPVVIDADGLNCISLEKDLLQLIPPGSVLTPHPREFDRLFGESANDFERIEKASAKARETNSTIILKGHHSFVATPAGTGYFNTTGNAGMATAGSGDVLTGLLTGLLCQGYEPEKAAILGVYLHGLAGDIAAEKLSMEGMIAGDITDYLPLAFKRIAEY